MLEVLIPNLNWIAGQGQRDAHVMLLFLNIQ